MTRHSLLNAGIRRSPLVTSDTALRAHAPKRSDLEAPRGQGCHRTDLEPVYEVGKLLLQTTGPPMSRLTASFVPLACGCPVERGKHGWVIDRKVPDEGRVVEQAGDNARQNDALEDA